MRFRVRGYLSSALLGALLVAQSLALLVPTIAGGKGGVPPPNPGLPVLSSVSFTPAIVPGGSPATGTVKFGSVTDGAVVTLFNSNGDGLRRESHGHDHRHASHGAAGQ